MKKDNKRLRKITLNDIAEACGVSKMTVSMALRKHSRISEKMRKKVSQKAEELGYYPDPALAALHRYRRSSLDQVSQASIAWINAWPNPDSLRKQEEFNLYWKGAFDSAKDLGYRLEEFRTEDISMKRLDGILKTRNINGILLPPLYTAPTEELLKFNWSNYSVVRFGISISGLNFHFVSSAQMKNTVLTFERALTLGYKRIGFISGGDYTRHFTSGYLWAQQQIPIDQRLPLLTIKQSLDIDDKVGLLKPWIESTTPDAIITDRVTVYQLLIKLGYRIPEDIGLATTSVHDTPIDSGVDQRPYEIGLSATRKLNSLMIERSLGLPEYCEETIIPGRWVEGTMLPPKHGYRDQ